MVLINFICRLHIPYDLYIDFTAARCLNRPLDLHFGPKNDENQYFFIKWRLKVQILDSKWFWSILLVDFISFTTFMLNLEKPMEHKGKRTSYYTLKDSEFNDVMNIWVANANEYYVGTRFDTFECFLLLF